MNNSQYYRGVIYKYTSPSGKVYIGLTTRESWRKYLHCWFAKKGYKGYFYNAIRKYGFNNLEYTVLFRTASKDKETLSYLLDVMESYYIRKYNANNPQYGYNLTEGGEGAKGVKRDGLAILLKKDGTTLRFASMCEAARYLGVPNLSGINAALRREYNVYKGYEVSYEDTTINRIIPKEESEGIQRLKNQFGNISFDLERLH